MAPVKYIAHGPHPDPLLCPVFVVCPPTEASFLSLAYEIISLQEVILFSVLFGVFLCCSFARGKIEVLSRGASGPYHRSTLYTSEDEATITFRLLSNKSLERPNVRVRLLP